MDTKNSNNDFQSDFNQGLSAFQKKQYDQAIQAFGLALAKKPKNKAALNNLALAHFQKGDKGQALAYFRKSLSFYPDDSAAADGRDFVLNQLEVKEIPHQIETYESLRQHFLVPVSLFSYLLLTACTMWGTGWIWIRYFGKQKSLGDNEVPPKMPALGFVFLFGFIAFLSLLTLKIFDQDEVRGTIIVPQVAVFAAPNSSSEVGDKAKEGQVEIFSLYSGLEVIVNRKQQNWYQITYPGAATGWIKDDALMITSEKTL